MVQFNCTVLYISHWHQNSRDSELCCFFVRNSFAACFHTLSSSSLSLSTLSPPAEDAGTAVEETHADVFPNSIAPVTGFSEAGLLSVIRSSKSSSIRSAAVKSYSNIRYSVLKRSPGSSQVRRKLTLCSRYCR